MSRRSNGLVGVWAEAQRQQQRQQEAQAGYQRDLDRQQRAVRGELAPSYREQRRAYREQREAEARRRTEEIDARVESLQRLLAAGCRSPAFRAGTLARAEQVAAFAPGQLAQPIRMPEQHQYQPQGGWTATRRSQA